MTLQELLDKIASIIELPKGILTIETQINTLQHWDSLAMVEIISLFEAHFQVIIEPRMLINAKTVADLIAPVQVQLLRE
jgi:acyl carrier protein